MVTATRNDLMDRYITLFGSVTSLKPGLLDVLNGYMRSLPNNAPLPRRVLELAKIDILQRECGWSFTIQELRTLAETLFP